MGRGSGTQKFVYQKWPVQTFPKGNFAFSRDGHFGWGGGGGRPLHVHPPCEQCKGIGGYVGPQEAGSCNICAVWALGPGADAL